MKRNATIPRRFRLMVMLAALSVGTVAFSSVVQTSPTVAESASAVATPTVISTVTVGLYPQGVGVNPTTNRVYVANDGHTVSVIDGTSNTIVATVPVGRNPYGVGVNSTTNRVYVANFGARTVSVIDGTSNTVVATVLLDSNPFGVGVNPTTNRVYIANNSSGTVSVIDGTSNTVVATVPVGGAPYGVGVNPTTNRVYVANSFPDNTVSVIDGTSNTVVATVPVGEFPSGVGVNPTTNRVYVANTSGFSVSVIDGTSNTVVATVPVGSFPYGVGVNSTNRVYVANSGSKTVSVIDGTSNTVVATVPVGSFAYGAGVNPTTNRVYVSNSFSKSVSVIDDGTTPVGYVLAPFNQGDTWIVAGGYDNNADQSVTGCHMGTRPDHCRNQLFGLDLVPDNQSDLAILAPVSGKVGWISSTFPGGCMGLMVKGGINVTICQFQAKPAFSLGQLVPRGKVLGTRSSRYVHLSLDSRYATGTLCSDFPRCFLPVPFTGFYTLERMSLSPYPNGALVNLNPNGTVAQQGNNYNLCQSKGQSCQFTVGVNQYGLPTALTGTSTNVAIP
jgi:YVTN family beta-propeller protein